MYLGLIADNLYGEREAGAAALAREIARWAAAIGYGLACPEPGQSLWSRARPSRMKSSANSNSVSSSHRPRAPPWVTARAISTT